MRRPVLGGLAAGGWGVDDQAGQPGGADQPLPVVGDGDLVGGQATAEVDRGGGAGDRTVGRRAVMRARQLDAQRTPSRPAVKTGRDRPKSLGKHGGRATVEEPERLGGTGHRHRGHHAFGFGGNDLDPHPLAKRSHSGPHQPVVRLRVPSHVASSYSSIRILSDWTPRIAAVTTNEPARRRLMLLDGHSIAYRAFFALPVENFSTTTGQPTNAVYGFTAMLINALRDEQPSHIAVAFDVSRKTFRAEKYAEYKAKRSETPVDFRGQVELIKEVLTALRIPSLSLEGYEADDLIATLATAAEAEDYDVLIVTGDRDTFQLVTDRVTVLYAVRGVSELARMTPQAVFDRYQLTPAQYPDFAALRGDPSDNLPGIPGVGEKTAAKWVREFGSFDALVDRVDEVPGKAGDALREHLSAVMTNRQLTELVRDVPLDVVTEGLVWPGWDRDAVHAVFDTLQFRVLRDRLYQTLTAAEPEAEAGFEVTGQLLGPGELVGWLTEHTAADARVGIAAAGAWGRGTGRLTGIGLAAADGAGAWVDPTALTSADGASLAEWLGDPDRRKVMRDAKGATRALAAHGRPLRGLVSDPALSAYLVLPGQRSFDLADLTLRFLRRQLRA